jgi:hypothetical protein
MDTAQLVLSTGATVAKQQQVTNWLPWIIGGLVVVVALIVISKI